MTIEEILRRIVRAHLNTIIACALIPLALVALVELRTAPTFSAQVRLQTVSTAPGSSTEAEGLSSRVLALATTPQVVQKALAAAGRPDTSQDAVEASLHRITAVRLGESPVVVLSVLDDSAGNAAKTVNALSKQVITFMNQGNRQPFDRTLADAKAQTASALARRDRLQRELLTTDGLQARANLQVMLAAAQKDLDQAEAQQGALVLSDVSRDQVVAVDASHPTVQRVASTLVPRSALAVLLGVLVGLALSVVAETLRPRIAGIRVMARALDAPVLGSTGQRRSPLAGSMSLAARRQGVETVVLVGVDDRDEKAARQLLAGMLQDRQETVTGAVPVPVQPSQVPSQVNGHLNGRLTGKHNAQHADVPRAPEPASAAPVPPSVTMSSAVRFTDRYGVTPAEEPTAGVVVVSAGTARRSNLDDVQDMVRAMRWPVVGVVELAPRRGWLASQ